MDILGHLPVTSRGHQWVLTAIFMNTSYMFTIPMKEKSAENVVQAYLSNIVAHKGGSIAILSDTGTEFKITTLNEACNQLGIKRIFSNLFHPQGNSRTENMHKFLKRTLTKFFKSSDLEWDELLLLACYYYNIFPKSNGTEPPFFSYLAMSQQKAD